MKYLISLIIFLALATPAQAAELSGVASNYSVAGCLRCSKNLIMANGEKLNDSNLTIALTPKDIRKYKLLNHFVGVINVTTKKSVIAKVTDTGGFAKLNRVADLSKATKEAIGCNSLCRVIIVF